MAEQGKLTQANTDPTKDTFQHREDLQFKDGRLGYWFRSPGDRIQWNGHFTYADPDNPSNTAIVGLASGKKVAVGGGVVVKLPEYSHVTGKYGKTGEQVQMEAAKFSRYEGDAQPDIVIGEPWSMLGDNDRVTSVAFGGKKAGSGHAGATQIAEPNPFDGAMPFIEHASQHFYPQ